MKLKRSSASESSIDALWAAGPAVELLDEVAREAAVVDDDLPARAQRPGGEHVAEAVKAEIGIAGMIDEVVRREDEVGVHRSDDLVDITIQSVAEEQLALLV